MKIDAHTGVVSQIMGQGGTTNLSSNASLAPLPANPMIGGCAPMVSIDNNRNLYIMEGCVGRTSTSARIYQYNIPTGQTRLYTGGTGALGYDGTAQAQGDTSSAIFVNSADFEFDESNNLYFFTTCSPGYAFNTQTMSMRLMKLTQNSDGSPGSLSVVAGNCTQGAPSSGTSALATPLSAVTDNLFTSMAVWNNGQTIYYSDGQNGTYKILNGVTHNTALTPTFGMTYAAQTNLLYFVGNDGSRLFSYSPNIAGVNGETLNSTLVGNGGTGNCNADGVPASATCMNLYGGLALNQTGQIFFGVGSANSPTRIRYVDSGGIMRTYAGTLPFYGDGLDRGLIRGAFSGIYYKWASEANQNAFPTGLYFMESTGGVIGYINDTNGITTSMAGNQTGILPAPYATGQTIDTSVSLGPNIYNALQGLTFDENGLPWFEYTGNVGTYVSLDANHQAVPHQNGGTLLDYAAAGSDPASTFTYGDSADNIVVHDQNLFFIGRFYDGSTYMRLDPVLRALQFGLGAVTQIMGNGTVTNNSVPDTMSAGPLASLSLSDICGSVFSYPCKVQYVANSVSQPGADRLYFNEGAALRFISYPLNPSQSLLTTAFTATALITSFIVSVDETQVFYIAGNHLYCHTLSGMAKSWCNDSNLGPPPGMNVINSGPNQLTWKSASALIISDYQGDIYEYTLLP